MTIRKDPFALLEIDEYAGDFDALRERPVSSVPTGVGAATATLHGFDLADLPVVTGLPGIPHENVAARSTVALTAAHIGKTLVVVFEQSEVRRPIVIGVIDADRAVTPAEPVRDSLVVEADDTRLVLTAEREVVLRCGEASITLTRAGKVLIRGTYVMSRSSGYNKIKGAAVDIN
jgi:hypothetical protein